jgi:hypothetical protein
MENNQPVQSKPTGRWPRYAFWLIVMLVVVIVFTLINKLFLVDYFVATIEGRDSILPWTNFLLVVFAEAALPVFLIWLYNRRRFQYSLRTLMIVVTVFAIVCSWFTVKMQQAKKQQESVEAIRKWGRNVRITYDWQRSTPLIPGWVRNLVGEDFFYNVYRLDILNTDLANTDMTPIKGLVQLEVLSFGGYKIKEDELKSFKELPKLRMLELVDTNMTDAGLAQLAGLKHLEFLSLSGTDITDAGLEHLKGLTKLQTLWLAGTQVTDAGLEHLKGLTQLQVLYLAETKVTDEGVKKLQQALPNCKVEH